eukprot:COSAG05_NODE_1067_length_5971_cov_450.254257_6_plen_72_part_00
MVSKQTNKARERTLSSMSCSNLIAASAFAVFSRSEVSWLYSSLRIISSTCSVQYTSRRLFNNNVETCGKSQ